MTVHYVKKDITTVDVGIVAHGVNCSGAMNSGVAKAIRNRWPLAYEHFMKHPKGRGVLGDAEFVYIPEEEVIVANCYTQVFYGYGGGKYADPAAIKRAMTQVLHIADLQCQHVYIPKIGCGLGGLNWEKDVRPIIDTLAEPYTRINIYVCDLPENKNEPDVT